MMSFELNYYDHAHAYVEQFEDKAMAHSYANWFVELWESTPEDKHIDLDHRYEYARFMRNLAVVERECVGSDYMHVK